MRPYAVSFPDSNPVKFINARKSASDYGLLRLNYAGPTGQVLVLEAQGAVPYNMNRMQVVKGSDYLFGNTDFNNLLLINALGPLDGSHIVKKFNFPWYMSTQSNEIFRVNSLLGQNKEVIAQIWTMGGRLLQFTFPGGAEEPQFLREVWHKRWRQRFRFPAKEDGSPFIYFYLPETGDYFSCSGCGSNGEAPCLYSWECFATCSTCSGTGEAECTSCPSGSSLLNGGCVKTCANNQYRKSKTECVDCPENYTFIKSNLTCFNCWDHNDYEKCEFTRLGYNISLIQDSFLNITFTYSIKFYGEQRSLEKLNRVSNNWPAIFKVSSIKDKQNNPECEEPFYKYNGTEKELRITLRECQRKARFSLRTLRTKVIQERYKVPLMLNLSSEQSLDYKILQADDDIPLYYRYLRFILWILILVFLMYLLLSEMEYLNNQPLKLIGNFLKMVDFIQCLSLLEVKYRVLTTKFFWLIELIFSSPQFDIFEGYLNDQEDLRRERYLGNLYENYGDKMAINNFDLVISVYFMAIMIDTLVNLLPCKLVKIKNITHGFREFLYSYAFFEFYINILMDILNTKKIVQKGNFLARLFLCFEMIIILTELIRNTSKLTEAEEDDGSKQIEESSSEKTKSQKLRKLKQEGQEFNLDTERDALIPARPEKSQKSVEPMTFRVSSNSRSLAKIQAKNINQRSKSLHPSNSAPLVSVRAETEQEPSASTENSTNQGQNLFSLILSKFEELSDFRFMAIQTALCLFRNPQSFQFLLILIFQMGMILLSITRLIYIRSKGSKLVELISVVQEFSITCFIVVIVIMGIREGVIEYLAIIIMSLSIIIEFASILILVALDLITALIKLSSKFKKNKIKNKKRKESVERRDSQPHRKFVNKKESHPVKTTEQISVKQVDDNWELGAQKQAPEIKINNRKNEPKNAKVRRKKREEKSKFELSTKSSKKNQGQEKSGNKYQFDRENQNPKKSLNYSRRWFGIKGIKQAWKKSKKSSQIKNSDQKSKIEKNGEEGVEKE